MYNARSIVQGDTQPVPNTVSLSSRSSLARDYHALEVQRQREQRQINRLIEAEAANITSIPPNKAQQRPPRVREFRPPLTTH